MRRTRSSTPRKRCAGFECAFGGALDRGPVGNRIAERDAELDDVGARFGERDDKFQSRIERRIARSDVRDDAEFTGFAQSGEALGDASGVGGLRGHLS